MPFPYVQFGTFECIVFVCAYFKLRSLKKCSNSHRGKGNQLFITWSSSAFRMVMSMFRGKQCPNSECFRMSWSWHIRAALSPVSPMPPGLSLQGGLCSEQMCELRVWAQASLDVPRNHPGPIWVPQHSWKADGEPMRTRAPSPPSGGQDGLQRAEGLAWGCLFWGRLQIRDLSEMVQGYIMLPESRMLQVTFEL